MGLLAFDRSSYYWGWGDGGWAKCLKVSRAKYSMKIQIQSLTIFCAVLLVGHGHLQENLCDCSGDDMVEKELDWDVSFHFRDLTLICFPSVDVMMIVSGNYNYDESAKGWWLTRKVPMMKVLVSWVEPWWACFRDPSLQSCCQAHAAAPPRFQTWTKVLNSSSSYLNFRLKLCVMINGTHLTNPYPLLNPDSSKTTWTHRWYKFKSSNSQHVGFWWNFTLAHLMLP